MAEQAIRIIWSTSASLISGVMVPLGVDLVFLADDAFSPELFLEGAVDDDFRFVLMKVVDSRDSSDVGELGSALGIILRFKWNRKSKMLDDLRYMHALDSLLGQWPLPSYHPCYRCQATVVSSQTK